MPIGLAIAGASIVGGLIQANAASDAASQASSASNRATDSQLQMFNTTNQQSAPWRQAGANALNQIGVGFGNAPPAQLQQGGTNSSGDPTATAWRQSQIQALPQGFMDTLPDGTQFLNTTGANAPELQQFQSTAVQPTNGVQQQSGGDSLNGIGQGQFNHQFTGQDLQTNLAPNYQWQLDQGLGALQNSQAGKSGLVSGNAMRGLNDYAQNFASGAYQNAFNNYNTQQSNIFNRLSTIAGLGSASANNSANVGATTGAGVANSMIGAGQAQAAGTVGMGNAISGGLNNAVGSWYGMKLLGNQSGSNGIGSAQALYNGPAIPNGGWIE